MIEKGEAKGWRHYQENHDWYRKNQLHSLKEVYVKDEFHE
jgi:NADH-quinone oxidoreductase subunit B